MKKLMLLALIAVGGLFASNEAQAQANWEAGLRFGDNFSADLTIPVGTTPRLHVPVYFDRFGVGALFDWMFALDGGPTGLKFYPGVGPEIFFENQFDFQIAGDFGAEYSFEFPLTIGIDWRPAFRLTNNADFNANNWGFIARFRFGEGASFKKAN
jgi:hypothetical protein